MRPRVSSALQLFPCGQFCGRSVGVFASVCREPSQALGGERGSGRKAAGLRAPGRPLQAMPETEQEEPRADRAAKARPWEGVAPTPALQGPAASAGGT